MGQVCCVERSGKCTKTYTNDDDFDNQGPGGDNPFRSSTLERVSSQSVGHVGNVGHQGVVGVRHDAPSFDERLSKMMADKKVAPGTSKAISKEGAGAECVEEAERLFGADIDGEKGPRVQSIVAWALGELDRVSSEEFSEEGLWRRSGSKKDLGILQRNASLSQRLDMLEIDQKKISCHTLANALLRFLKDIPGSLIDEKSMMQVVQDPEASASDVLDVLEYEMSESKFKILCLFLKHWIHVADPKVDNRMDADAVSTCVYCVICAKQDSRMKDAIITLIGGSLPLDRLDSVVEDIPKDS